MSEWTSAPAAGRGQPRGGLVARCALTALAVWLAAMPVLAQHAPPAPGASPDPAAPNAAPADFVEITPEMRAAVDRGLARLASLQAADGSFGSDRNGQNVGIVSLACIAFMADGSLPGRGRYGVQVERGLEFVLRNAQPNGLVAADQTHGPMYGHGFATLFLGEVYGQTGDRRVRDALVKAVRLIVSTQNGQGGWRYHPVPFDADLSVTICQIMGLRSARNAGLSVPKETIDKATEYVRNCQNLNTDGGFRYMISPGSSAFPRSAAGVASLYYAGIYEGQDIERGLEYLLRQRGDAARGGVGHYHYGHYYAAQAMYLAGGQYWAQWFPMIREEMLRQQQATGGWTSEHGEEYGTAMSLIVLQIPNRLLPIFQR